MGEWEAGQRIVLTLDIGTSSLRANLFTASAERLAAYETQLPYPTLTTPAGGSEIDPLALLEAAFGALDSILGRADDLAARIAGVGMCSLVSNVMGVDGDGQPTTPIYTWADTRCAPEAGELRDKLDNDRVRERTGCPIHASYLPARLLWLKRTQPEATGRTRQWISLGEWLFLRLFGKCAQSLSVASWGGLLNRHTLDWDSVTLSLLGLERERLPALVDADEPLSGLRAEYAERWPTLRNVPWFPCVGDGAAGNLGSGCHTPDALALQAGTSGAMRAVVPGGVAHVPGGLWCYRVSREAALLGGALSEGGNVFAWLRDTLNLGDLAAVQREAARLEPDSHGLTVLPFLAGERSPGWRGAARATISGLSLHTGPAEIVRAAQEAITYRFGAVYSLLLHVLPPPRLIVGSGGAFLSAEGWPQMMADVLGSPVTASRETEASSKGTAMLALHSLGLISDFAEIAPSLGETYSPNMKHHEVYKQAMERQRVLYERLEIRD